MMMWSTILALSWPTAGIVIWYPDSLDGGLPAAIAFPLGFAFMAVLFIFLIGIYYFVAWATADI